MKTTLMAYKDSAIIKPGCLRPHMIELLLALLATSPDTHDGIMWVTEAWRPARHTDDAHTWCNAFDIRSKNVIERGNSNSLRAKMTQWGRDTRQYLRQTSGVHSFQFEAHGDGQALHLHAEFDPR